MIKTIKNALQVVIPGCLTAMSIVYFLGGDLSLELVFGALLGSSLAALVMHIYTQKKARSNDGEREPSANAEGDCTEEFAPDTVPKPDPVITYIGQLIDISFFGTYLNPASCIKTDNGFVTVSGHVHAAPLDVPVFAVFEEDKFPLIRIDFGDTPKAYQAIRSTELSELLTHLEK
jgi:hypothetical protein